MPARHSPQVKQMVDGKGTSGQVVLHENEFTLNVRRLSARVEMNCSRNDHVLIDNLKQIIELERHENRILSYWCSS